MRRIPPLLGLIVALIGIVLAVALFTVRLWTHREPPFVAISVDAANDQDAHAQMAEIERSHKAKIDAMDDRIHAEMVALTLLGMALLLLPLKAPDISEWTKYVVKIAAAASVAACLVNW